jgi:hypothetical protein
MTTFRIRKGWHHALPPVDGVFHKRRSFKKAVVFTASCRQAPEGVDYWDVNKLFGIGYFRGGHHMDSARFGWRYDAVNDKISLYAYSYVAGERRIKHITCVPLEREVHLELFVGPREYWFGVKQPGNPFYSAAAYYEPFTHKKKWAYALSPYYGGTSTPAKDVFIRLKSLPQ